MNDSFAFGGDGGALVSDNSLRRRTAAPRSLPAARVVVALALVSILGSVTGCGDQLGRSGSSTAACPSSPLTTLIARDVSGTQASPDLDAGALSVMDQQIDLAVACAAASGRGQVTVRLFATNAAQTATVLSRELAVSGATAIARQRKAERDGLAAALKAELRQGYASAVDELPATASDVLSQFPLALEHVEQLNVQTGEAWALNFVVLSDGLASRPDGLTDGSLTVEMAQQLAAEVSPPWEADFKPWRVSIVGLGRIAGEQQPSTDYIEALKAFYRAWLEGRAEQVMVVTDYPTASDVEASQR